MPDINCTFSNPILKDRIKILKETENQLIFRTYLEPTGGQSKLHFHTKIIEKFQVIQGELTVLLDKDENVFRTNESQLIAPLTSHRFYNKSNEEVVFDVEITHPGRMKHALQIMYGLAEDGKTNKAGLPKNLFHLAIGLNMMDAYSPDFSQKLQHFAIKTLADLGKAMGMEKKLMEKYCKE